MYLFLIMDKQVMMKFLNLNHKNLYLSVKRLIE